ncbi:MAG TPA: MarR family transcriptional regulator [Alphaproteobacteria bacterium]|nr:MarR family transcriptional regulator [Alphaproteobacteria bacterium]
MSSPYYSAKAYRARSSIGYLIRRAHNLLMPRVEGAFAEHEVTFTQWVIMMYLRDGLATTAAGICRDIFHDSGALTRAIDQLEQRGFIQRRRSTQDRRTVELILTPEGAGIVESLIPLVVGCLNRALAGFTHDEIDTLSRLLTKLVAENSPSSDPARSADLELTR